MEAVARQFRAEGEEEKEGGGRGDNYVAIVGGSAYIWCFLASTCFFFPDAFGMSSGFVLQT